MLNFMEIQFLGVQLQIVDICFSLKMMIKQDFNVYNVKNNIVLSVVVNGIKT
jgi:hypothetical protein